MLVKVIAQDSSTLFCVPLFLPDVFPVYRAAVHEQQLRKLPQFVKKNETRSDRPIVASPVDVSNMFRVWLL